MVNANEKCPLIHIKIQLLIIKTLNFKEFTIQIPIVWKNPRFIFDHHPLLMFDLAPASSSTGPLNGHVMYFDVSTYTIKIPKIAVDTCAMCEKFDVSTYINVLPQKNLLDRSKQE